MMKNELLLVFGEDFGRHPHCLEHIIKELMPLNTVFWIETIGMRSPNFSFYDVKRILQLIYKWTLNRGKKNVNKANRNLKIIAPPMLPFTSWKLVRKINLFSVRRKIDKEIKRMGLSAPIVITSIPSACDFVKLFKEKLTVYYCVDEFSLWPGIPQDRVKRMERELIAKSDLIFATSSSLVRSKNSIGRETHLLTHGVDVNHFSLKIIKNKKKQKKICYFGLIDERCDQKLIAFIAEALPECTITIIGEVVVPNTAILKKCSNIIFEKRVTYEELPDKIQDQDYFILPYHINELTNNINPLKIKEYLATGRPVVSTALPEVVKLAEFLYIAETPVEFVNLLQGLIQGTVVHSAQETHRFLVQNETWKAKANFFSNKMRDAMSSKELMMK
ncbi:MAG: glycosyltransferase [Bdellovibrio sp.]|nr:glycosyltransferase [Bdellovibrio sp.]